MIGGIVQRSLADAGMYDPNVSVLLHCPAQTPKRVHLTQNAARGRQSVQSHLVGCGRTGSDQSKTRFVTAVYG